MKLPSVVALSCASVAVCSAAEPTAVTAMRVKEIPEMHAFCAKKDLKLAEISQFAGEKFPALIKKAADLKLTQRGSPLMSYVGFKGDPEQTFSLEVALPVVTEDDDYRGEFYFRVFPKFKCASVIYQGPLAGIGEAWQKLVEQSLAAGHQPTGESREWIFYFESPDSSNNVIELEFGIK